MRVPKSHANLYWENLTLAMIGEQFRNEDEINGLVIALKPNMDTISVWNKNAKNKEVIQSIKEDIEEFVKIEQGMKIDYEVFQDIINGTNQKE